MQQQSQAFLCRPFLHPHFHDESKSTYHNLHPFSQKRLNSPIVGNGNVLTVHTRTTCTCPNSVEWFNIRTGNQAPRRRTRARETHTRCDCANTHSGPFRTWSRYSAFLSRIPHCCRLRPAAVAVRSTDLVQITTTCLSTDNRLHFYNCGTRTYPPTSKAFFEQACVS